MERGQGGEASASFVFDENVMAAALVRIYERKFNPVTEVERGLFRETFRAINEATDRGFRRAHFNPSGEFERQIRANNAVFSAFKVHRQQNQMAAKLLDENGKLKPFGKWVKDVQPIADHYNKQWLKTEYNTAILRAQRAAEFKQFQAEADVLPNLKWVRTTSLNPGADHVPFWSLPVILPVNDPFWNEHHPADRWNCKCGWINTDEGIKRFNSTPKSANTQPQPGLENNPATDGKMFSDKHPYFPANCAACPINGKRKNLFVFRQRKNCYACANAAEITKPAEKSANAEDRKKYLAQMMPLLKKSVQKTAGKRVINIKFTKYGNKHLYSDTFGRSGGFRREDLKNIDRRLQNATFVKTAEISKNRKDGIIKFYYFKDNTERFFYNVGKTVKVEKDGRFDVSYFLYSITSAIKEK